MNEWKKATLEELAHFQRGFDISKAEQQPGSVPVVSSSGVTSYHSVAKVKGPGVTIGRKGTLGTVFYSPQDYWPHSTSLWVTDFKGNEPKFVYYFLKTLGLEQFDVGASNPTLNRNHIHGLQIKIPNIKIQQRIAAQFRSGTGSFRVHYFRPENSDRSRGVFARRRFFRVFAQTHF